MKEKWIPVDDLFRDFQKIRGEETGENPTKAPSSTFFLSRFSGFWFSIEQVLQRERERERERILLVSDKSKVQSFFILYVCQLQEDNLLRQLLHGRGTTQFFNGSDFMHFWWTIFLFAVVSSPSNWVPSSIFFFFFFHKCPFFSSLVFSFARTLYRHVKY